MSDVSSCIVFVLFSLGCTLDWLRIAIVYPLL